MEFQYLINNNWGYPLANHGGSDPGAVGNGINEKDLTLEISKLMYEEFLDYGVPVTLVRDSDETVSPDERVKRILDAYGNGENVIVISNHINAGGVNFTQR